MGGEAELQHTLSAAHALLGHLPVGQEGLYCEAGTGFFIQSRTWLMVTTKTPGCASAYSRKLFIASARLHRPRGGGVGGGEEGNRGEYECISPCISLRERGLPQLLEQAREHRPTDRRLT